MDLTLIAQERANLKKRLEQLFLTFRAKVDNQNELIEILTMIGSEGISLTRELQRNHTPPAKQRQAITRYRKALLSARLAYMEIPRPHELWSWEEIEEPATVTLNGELERGEGPLAPYTATLNITISRVTEHPLEPTWQLERDVLDLLIRGAEKLEQQTDTLPRPDFMIPILRRAALHCRKEGIRPSAAPSSKFYRIAEILVPFIQDLRPHIKNALSTLPAQ